jgi:hypothetical protein
MKKSVALVAIIIAILFVVAIPSAFADTATVNATPVAGKLTAADTVTVSATINSKLVMEVTTPGAAQSVDFGALDPGSTVATGVAVTVWSNKAFQFSSAAGGSASLMGLSTVAFSPNWTKTNNAGRAFADTYTLNVPWDTDPGAYTATVTYTAVQN